MKKEIKLREASIRDLELLQFWDTQPHVIASDPDDDWDWEYELGRNPEWREQLIAELNGIPLGAIQIIDPQQEESHYWGNIGPNKRAIDLWIGKREHLGKGYGSMIMTQVLNSCFTNTEVTEVMVDPLESNVKAINFYEKLGFKFVEKRRFGNHSCKVYSIARNDWKRLY